MFLNIKNVSFNYDNQQILKNISLTLSSNDFTYLIGKSGSGKTTLLKLIYMDIFPSEGDIEFYNYKSSSIKPKDIPYLRRKIGVIFQDFKLLNDRTIYENLELVLRVTETPVNSMKKKIINSLTDVGLSHKQNNYPSELSGGEKQRIAIARAIINEPMLILADEPTGNLDPETGEEIINILKQINRRGTAILCATHNYDLVKKVESKIIKLSNGTATQVVLKSKN
ncbi:MAG TPA: ATP-binding cassette domain-containing protein [Melioribacteraceae bacterium]|mgnify:CR=1 FL=1|nr:ATP-binding cassette domain-containing protein [Melioribacteraceae bacterium]